MNRTQFWSPFFEKKKRINFSIHPIDVQIMGCKPEKSFYNLILLYFKSLIFKNKTLALVFKDFSV